MQRRRPRKPRLTRMDAAVDAMSQLGFQDRLVKKCVKQLLKEYGGDDAWPFIEEYSYKELIEAILRDNEENDPGSKVREDGETSQDHQPLMSSLPEPENTSNGTETAPETSNMEPENTQEVAFVNSSNSDAEPDCSKLLSSSSAEGDTTSWKDIVQDQTFVSTEQTDDAVRRNGIQANVDTRSWEDTVQLQDQTFVSTEQTNDAVHRNGKQAEVDTTSLEGAVQDQTFVSTKQPDDSVNRNGKQLLTPEPADTIMHKSGDDPNKMEAVYQASSPMIGNRISFSLLPPANKATAIRRLPCYGWIEDDDGDSPNDFVYSKPAIESNTSYPLPIINKQMTRRCVPCYGWIEEDEDSPNDFVYSKPATGSFGPKADDRGNKVLRSPLGSRKRKKSRWDEGPNYL